MKTSLLLHAASLLLCAISVNATMNQYFRSKVTTDASNMNDGIGVGADIYTVYSGDGSQCDGWPTMEDWVSFGDMWTKNALLITNGCAWFIGPHVPNNHEHETTSIFNSIQSIANATNVDHRFILAIMMQESRGCVRVPTTANAVSNPGLMQCHDGPTTCADHDSTTPCPPDKIWAMINEGVGGTETGDGLAAILTRHEQLGYEGAQLYYRAAREYNSGHVDESGLLEVGVATKCYASTVANRLVGWGANQVSYDCPFDG